MCTGKRGDSHHNTAQGGRDDIDNGQGHGHDHHHDHPDDDDHDDSDAPFMHMEHSVATGAQAGLSGSTPLMPPYGHLVYGAVDLTSTQRNTAAAARKEKAHPVKQSTQFDVSWVPRRRTASCAQPHAPAIALSDLGCGTRLCSAAVSSDAGLRPAEPRRQTLFTTIALGTRQSTVEWHQSRLGVRGLPALPRRAPEWH
jgi:hypothetical protein